VGSPSKKQFNVPITDLIKSSKNGIPNVLVTCCAWIENHAIEVEGIWKSTGSKQEVNRIVADFDEQGQLTLTMTLTLILTLTLTSTSKTAGINIDPNHPLVLVIL